MQKDVLLRIGRLLADFTIFWLLKSSDFHDITITVFLCANAPVTVSSLF